MIDIKGTMDSSLGIIPIYIYLIIVGLLIVELFCYLFIYDNKKAIGHVAKLVLFEYIFLVLCSTVLFRRTIYESNLKFEPFWSYWAIIKEGKMELLSENFMNVVLFIPIGFLLSFVYPQMRLRRAISIGCMISLFIELLQFVFKKGYCELDDFIHNTIGCFIGVILFSVFRFLFIKNRTVNRVSSQF